MDGWNVIKDAADIEELLLEYGGFHDSCLVNASWNSGMYVDANNGMHLGEAKDYRLQMLFHSQWNKRPLELMFIRVREYYIAGWQERYSNDIFDCYLKIHTDISKDQDGSVIIWADTEGFDPCNVKKKGPLEEPKGASYVVADQLAWRFIE